MADGLARLSAVFRLAVERARAAGEVRARPDPRTLATYLVACMNGLRTMIKAGATRRAARNVVSVMLQALD